MEGSHGRTYKFSAGEQGVHKGTAIDFSSVVSELKHKMVARSCLAFGNTVQPIDVNGAWPSPNIVLTAQAHLKCFASHPLSDHLQFLPFAFWTILIKATTKAARLELHKRPHSSLIISWADTSSSLYFLTILINTFQKYLNTLQGCCPENMRLSAYHTVKQLFGASQDHRALRNSDSNPGSLLSGWLHVSNLTLKPHFSKRAQLFWCSAHSMWRVSCNI